MGAWLLIICCICACKAGGIGGYLAMGKKKAPTKRKTKPTPAPEPVVPAVEPVAEPLLPAVPPLMPLATTSTLIPSYSMVAAPVSYAAPAYATHMLLPQPLHMPCQPHMLPP